MKMKKIVTNEGKLFGLINVIDLLVIVLVVCAAAVAVMFVRGGDKTADSAFSGVDGSVDMVFYAEEVSDFVIDKVKANGEPVYDEANLQTIGYVTGVETGEARLYGLNSEGIYQTGDKDFYSSAYIRSTMPVGTRTRLGVTYRKANYGVGHSLTIRAGDAKIYLRIYDIKSTARRLRRDIDMSDNGKFLEKAAK